MKEVPFIKTINSCMDKNGFANGFKKILQLVPMPVDGVLTIHNVNVR